MSQLSSSGGRMVHPSTIFETEMIFTAVMAVIISISGAFHLDNHDQIATVMFLAVCICALAKHTDSVDAPDGERLALITLLELVTSDRSRVRGVDLILEVSDRFYGFLSEECSTGEGEGRCEQSQMRQETMGGLMFLSTVNPSILLPLQVPQLYQAGIGVVDSESTERDLGIEQMTFLDRLPEEMIYMFIWPLLVGNCRHTKEVRQVHIRRQVCKSWRRWVERTDEWRIRVTTYIENMRIVGHPSCYVLSDVFDSNGWPLDLSYYGIDSN
ncbi:hypothetical protein M758_UG254500 [Ceratodon purpureus]|nr:hypothetical protein M758_UG254500 [Ceratodon purpureus]